MTTGRERSRLLAGFGLLGLAMVALLLIVVLRPRARPGSADRLPATRHAATAAPSPASDGVPDAPRTARPPASPADLALTRKAAELTARIESLGEEERFAEARSLAGQQLALAERLEVPDDSLVAAAWSAVARTELGMGNTSAATDADSLALKLRLRRFGPRHLDVAESLSQLGRDLKGTGGQRDAAIGLFERALQLYLDLAGPDREETAQAMQDLANLYRLNRRGDEAIALLTRALDIRRRVLGGGSNEVASTLTGLAFVHTTRGDWAAAEKLLREAVAIRRNLPRISRLQLSVSLNAWGQALRHLGRATEAAPLLAEAVQLREAIRRDIPPGSGRATYYSLSGRLELAAATIEAGDSSGAWASLEPALGRQIMETLAVTHGLSVDALTDLTVADVQRVLPRDGALVGWLDFWNAASDGYPFWGYVIRPTGPIHWVRREAPPGPHRAPWEIVGPLARRLQVAGAWPLRLGAGAELDSLTRWVYRERVQALEPWLIGIRHLIVESGDIFHGVPLEVLPDSTGRRLGDRFQISYVPSASFYLWQARHHPRPRPAARWRGLLVSDPTTRSGAAPSALAPLHEAQREVAGIAALLPGAVCLSMNSADTLRALARAGRLEEFDLLHFATHAHVEQMRPERSGLFVGGELPGNSPPLTAEEIAGTWRLHAELVVLSGCSTYRGRSVGIEGVLGLNQAFLVAGTRALLASLWPMDDTATALLIERFYGNLVGAPGRPALDCAAALQEARIWLRGWQNASGETPYAHPAYWAALVMIGAPE